MAGKKIIGFRKGTSKKGNPYCFVSCTEPYENVDGAVGIQAINVSVFKDDIAKVTNDCIGKTMYGYFGYSNGMVSVQGMEIK